MTPDRPPPSIPATTAAAYKRIREIIALLESSDRPDRSRKISMAYQDLQALLMRSWRDGHEYCLLERLEAERDEINLFVQKRRLPPCR